ncbi:MAG: 16S rRNA (guanine(527)-N(7))-methyltransferase RsmG [Lentisphaeria bacterium]
MFTEFAKTPESQKILKYCGLLDNKNFFDKIERFYRNLVETNETLNLTRITEPEEFWVKNVLDALLITYEVPRLAESNIEEYLTVMDIGCGGGIPLIPLAIAFPFCEFIGFESRRKKAYFLLEQIEDLELKNCEVLPFRAIEASRMERYTEQADIVTARAVARIEKLVPETVKFLKPKGHMVFYKTPTQLEEESDSAKIVAKKYNLSFKPSEKTFELPCEFGSRQFAILSPKFKVRYKNN